MTKEVIGEDEEVKKHCKHKDCVYRVRFAYGIECCAYMLATGKPRGCSISECDKCRPGTRKVKIDWKTMAIVWEYGDGNSEE